MVEFGELKCLDIVAGSCSGNGSKTAYKFPKRGLAFMTKTSHFRTCRWLGRNSLEGRANIKIINCSDFCTFFQMRAMGACCNRWPFDAANMKAWVV